jgi:hypothetical protein
MKIAAFCFLVLSTLPIQGCATKKDASEKNFSVALDVYLAKRGQLCLGIASKWPIDVDERERGTTIGRAPVMAALEKVGLVRSHETETEYPPPLSSSLVETKVLRYDLTDEGKKFYIEKEHLGLAGQKETQGDLCYGQQMLDKIVKWEGPVAVGDYKEVSVFYTYKIENLANWVTNPEFQRLFPGAALTINDAGKTMLDQALTLTNQGWEAKGLDSPL